MATDFAALDTKALAEKGMVVELEGPDGEPLLDAEGKQYWIRQLGGDAGKIREKHRKSLDKVYEKVRKGKAQGGAAESEREQIDRLAAAVLEWYVPTLDGETLVCTEENARRLYSDPRLPWLPEQLQKRIDDRAAFFATRSTS